MKTAPPWQSGRFDRRRKPGQILFGRMYEDVEIERAAFNHAGRVFCIASAGCTALRLSEDHEVIACDINPVQLAYAERRVTGGGGLETGTAERILSFARTFMPLIGWRRDALRAFLNLSDPAEQITFWREQLNTRRFRACFDLLMSVASLRAVYAREFLSFLPAMFGAVLRRRLERCLARHANTANPYLRALLTGESDTEPPSKTAQIQFVLGDAASYLESCREGYFDAFTLSNILDGTAESYRERLFRAVSRAASKDAVVVLRSFAEPASDLTTNHAEHDRSALWGVVDVRCAHGF